MSDKMDAASSAALIVAKSALTAVPLAEMEALTLSLQQTGRVGRVAFAFSEQGTPSFRDALIALVREGHARIDVLPLVFPMEPSFRVWLTRAVQRLRGALPELSWPDIVIVEPPRAAGALTDMLVGMLENAADAELVPAKAIAPEGSTVPLHKQRVLVCQGGPCNDRGAALVWGHFRNEQARLGLRDAGTGVMSAKTSCLGPCNLGPVLQVYPDGTYYGGVDEAGVDRIIAEHLLGGQVVADLAYAPSKTKQRLRAPGTDLDSTS